MANQSGREASIQMDTGGGTFENIIDCSRWTMTRKVKVYPYASCSTNGNTARITGTRDATGTLEGYTDDALHISTFIQEGDAVALRLYLNAVNFWDVPAVITEVSEEANVEEGSILKWTASWEADGTYTYN